MQPWLAHYGSHTAESYAAYTSYITTRAAFALARLPANVDFNITTNNGSEITVDTSTTTVQGDGWINVREIRINNSPESLPVVWIDGDTWMVTVPVVPGSNAITLTAFDHQGAQIGTDTIQVIGTGTVVPATASNLVVSEIMYNPALGGGDEFIELMNIDAQTIDLAGCLFTSGIDHPFAAGTTLAAGARLIVARSAFLNGTSLASGGERVTLSGPGAVVIQDFSYDDDAPWPAGADGLGRSLVLVAPLTNPDPKNPLSWRASAGMGGNPGGSDAAPAPANVMADDDGNGSPNLLDYALVMPRLETGLDAAGHLTLAFDRHLPADDVIYLVETSADFQTWTTGPSAVERVSQANPEGSTALETWRTVAPANARQQHFIRLRVQLR